MANNSLNNPGIAHSGNIHIANAIHSIFEHHPSFNDKKGSLGKGFITKTKPHLNKGMNSLNKFAEHIGKVEMHYQSVLDGLDSSTVGLEDRVHLEDSAKQHVINLKSLHEKQKITLTKITELFLQLSKERLKEMKQQR